MALLLGCSYEALSRAELGYASAIPRGIVEALERCGYDAAGLRTQYREWREWRGRAGRGERGSPGHSSL